MGNQKIRQYYSQMSDTIETATATRNKALDSSPFDTAFVRKHKGRAASVLELGAGTGLLMNEIMDEFSTVVAVELYPRFSDFIRRADHVTVITADIQEFDTSDQFDLVLLFGVMNYFDAAEAAGIYRACARFCAPGGTLIVKHQMGVDEDVTVDHFSEELGRHYYSNYRHIQTETALMQDAGFRVDTVADIYPDAFNRWSNTRFTAVVASKP